MRSYGKKTWLIPDGFLSSVSGEGEQKSHEAICVINTSPACAHIKLTLLFEDREPMEGFLAECPSMRTHHIRMDKIEDTRGRAVPRDLPYAILLESSEPVAVQYSRLDTSSARMALMTTVAYPAE